VQAVVRLGTSARDAGFQTVRRSAGMSRPHGAGNAVGRFAVADCNDHAAAECSRDPTRSTPVSHGENGSKSGWPRHLMEPPPPARRHRSVAQVKRTFAGRTSKLGFLRIDPAWVDSPKYRPIAGSTCKGAFRPEPLIDVALAGARRSNRCRGHLTCYHSRHETRAWDRVGRGCTLRLHGHCSLQPQAEQQHFRHRAGRASSRPIAARSGTGHPGGVPIARPPARRSRLRAA